MEKLITAYKYTMFGDRQRKVTIKLSQEENRWVLAIPEEVLSIVIPYLKNDNDERCIHLKFDSEERLGIFIPISSIREETNFTQITVEFGKIIFE